MRTDARFKQDNPYQQNICAELVYLLYSQAVSAIIGTMIIATFLVCSLYKVIPDHKVFGWYAIMLTMAVVRYVVVKIYMRRLPPPTEQRFWRRVFSTMALFAGVCWSFAGSYLMPPDPAYQVLIACALSGVTAGAIPFFSGSRTACALFVIPILSTFALWSFLQGGVAHLTLSVIVISYLILLLVSATKTNNVIYNAVRLKFANDELVSHLTAAQQQMVVTNQSLNQAAEERSRAEERLRESEEQYRLVTDALPVMIAYIDTDLVFRFNNKAYESSFGKPLESITGRSIQEVFNADTLRIFMENYAKLTTTTSHSFETIIRFENHDERYVSITMIPHVKDNVLQGMFTLISDMTPRINYMATHDALTDLPNRTLFMSRFSQALQRGEDNSTRVALLFLDLDNFKNINDTQGHDIGDMLLVSVAARVNGCIRGTDTLSRLGGDEFTIIIEDIDTNTLVKTAHRICQAFNEPFQLPMHEVFITTSIGISVFPADGVDTQVLIKSADLAIYRAKEKGKNTFEFYTSALNDQFQRKATLEMHLRTAIENHELNVYYQPIIDMASNTIVSVEALLRWHSPELGAVSPVEFIPVAEESGLIVPIGEWVLREVCKQNSIWENARIFPKKLHIAVNLSARQFKEAKLVEQITAALAESGQSGDFLTLELTESLIMQDIESNIVVLQKLKALGIVISIDDFGTGYSSLSYLHRIPIDIIKIDRSFITDVLHGGSSADAIAIITAIIALSHSLKKKVIAEGVETVAQYDFLHSLDCDQIQGFLISPPVPVLEVTAFLQRAFTYENYLKFRRFDKEYQDKRWTEYLSKHN